ncbi:hypothetical protein WDZ92_08650, partial [Nostoc sp. NIES-2111]
TILGAIIAGTWRLSQQKIEILKIIDNDIRIINSNLESIKYSLGIHITEYKNKDELTQFKLSSLEENLKDSFRQCRQEIRRMQVFLKKDYSQDKQDSVFLDSDL